MSLIIQVVSGRAEGWAGGEEGVKHAPIFQKSFRGKNMAQKNIQKQMFKS